VEFKVFAKKLKNVIGGKSNTKIFTKTIFEAMMNESGAELLAGTSPDTFKAYFNGNTSISKVAALILANLSDDDEFPSYLDGFGETTAQLLADEFIGDIPDINAVNASTEITDLFLEILREASGKEKSTPKSAKKDSETYSIEIPEEQTDESPYSSEDNSLLQEFTADYDEIMVTLIGENYAESLIDMTLPCRIKDLYETKWISKADAFADPSLKSYVFGLLGELNNISNSFLLDNSATPFFKSARTKIRNLYVKLHPDQFAGSFPYDAFIDDWDDGEYQ
jgi:hypothetical protein